MRLIDCFVEIMAFTVHFLREAPAEQPSSESVAERYDALIARSEAMRTRGRFSGNDWTESFFAVCCWVDESILCSDWSEKAKWLEHQLQHRRFNTTNGGDEFFAHLEALGDNARDAKEVYGHCLALGFKGRFFDQEHQKALIDVIRANFETVEADSEFVSRVFMFPAAYGVEHAKKQRSFAIYAVMCVVAALPVALFAGLYIFYGKALDQMVFQYFH